jgi:hypothetical protein
MFLRGLLLIVLSLGSSLSAFGQIQVFKPTWVYAHDLRARKGGTTDFDKDTPKIGVEFFRDDTSGAVLGISQTGSLTATSAVPGAEKKAPWVFAHDLRARKSDEDKFTATTAKYGVEAFKDLASGKLLYLSEKSTVTFADMPASLATDKEPVWHHALIVKVRTPSEREFGKDTKKFGIEVFKDGNTGGLIYISETAALATSAAPEKMPAPDKVRAPKALYGLTFKSRKASEAEFSDMTKSYGVEVFRDENTNGLIYVSETGSIATAPGMDTKLGQGVSWKHGMTLKVRPGGDKDFKNAMAYGVECFRDNNTGYTVYIADNGNIAVVATK